jgi:glucose/mannose-6-phosphate isomerase
VTDHDPLDPAGADPQGMLGVVRSSPDLWARGSTIAADVTWQVNRPTAVVVAGMGGSGIAGDVAALVAGTAGTVPVIVAKGYDLPAWAGPGTPVIAVSHSGNTEETLTVVDAAFAAGCSVGAVTSGGRLADIVSSASGPVVDVPGDHQPRASFPLLVPPTLALLAAVGAVPHEAVDTGGVAASLAPRMAELERAAAAAADRLQAFVPVFVGGRGLLPSSRSGPSAR